jgi:hypothetical protein
MTKTILDFAKLLTERGLDFGLDRSHFHAEIEKRAAQSRRHGESKQQSYSRFITESAEGVELFKALRRAPAAPPQAPQDTATRNTKPLPGPASEEMAALARKLSRERKISYAQAYTRLFESEAHRDLRDRIKVEEAEATRAVRDQREPIWRAEEELERDDFRLGSSPGSRRI